MTRRKKKSKTGDYLIAAALLAFLFIGLKGGGDSGADGEDTEPADDGNGGTRDRVTLALRLATPKHFWHVLSSKGKNLHDKVALAFPDVLDSHGGPDHVLFGQTPNDASALDRLLSVLPVIFNLFDVDQFVLEVDAGYRTTTIEAALDRVRAALHQLPAARELSINLKKLA